MEHQLPPLGLPLDSGWINSVRKKLLWTSRMDIYARTSKARETQQAVEILKLELADHAWNQPNKLKWDGIPHQSKLHTCLGRGVYT